MSNDRYGDPSDRLAGQLMVLAGDQNVRALEALAAALANRTRQTPGGPLPADARDAGRGLEEPGAIFAGQRYELCRRIARRALRGTLDHLAAGANAFHRIDADPPWAGRLLPVAVFGSFLFYRTADPDQSLLPPAIGVEHEPEQHQGCEIERVLDVRGRGLDDGRE